MSVVQTGGEGVWELDVTMFDGVEERRGERLAFV
jgi:hypothetical protein